MRYSVTTSSSYARGCRIFEAHPSQIKTARAFLIDQQPAAIGGCGRGGVSHGVKSRTPWQTLLSCGRSPSLRRLPAGRSLSLRTSKLRLPVAVSLHWYE